jgi:hypothetical protein
MIRHLPRKEQPKKSGWTQKSATNHICKVNRGWLPMGLSYCSACDFLHVSMAYAKTM